MNPEERRREDRLDQAAREFTEAVLAGEPEALRRAKENLVEAMREYYAPGLPRVQGPTGGFKATGFSEIAEFTESDWAWLATLKIKA